MGSSMMDISQYEYPELKPGDQDWRWFHKYPHDILTGKVPAGKMMRLAAERHFRDLERDDVAVNEEAAKSIVAWFKFIPITDGKNAGQPTILLPWQIWLVVSLIAWIWNESTWDDDGNPLRVKGERRFNQTFILVARKGGKSTLAAGIMLYLMHKAGFQPRAYSLATKRDQAKIVLKTAQIMIKLSPRLRSVFESRTNDILVKEGEFRALASDSNSLDGLNPDTTSLDECHAIKDRNLYGVVVSAFGAKTEYLSIVITTAGFILDGLCTDLYKNGEAVLSGEVEQDNYFYAMWQIDADDDWSDPQAWYKSNPGVIYGLPSMRYLHDRYKEASLSFAEKANFITKHCNLFVNGVDKWLDIDKIKMCSHPELNINDYLDRKCYIGFDRSLGEDITSLYVVVPDEDGGITIFGFNLQTREAIKNATDYLRKIYQKAEAEGFLDVIEESSRIRNEMVKSLIRKVCAMFKKHEHIAYDPYKMKEVAMDLEDEGYNMLAVSQGAGNLSEPTKKFESLVEDGLLRYNGDTLFEFACTCAVMDVTKFNNVAIFKEDYKNEKIDPLISVIIALSSATLFSTNASVYNQKGLRFI
ncbi:terminase large subunit [Vibrio phage D63]